MRLPLTPSLTSAAASRRQFLTRASGAGIALASTGTRLFAPNALTVPTAHADSAATDAAAQVMDWDVPGGHFYTQTTPKDVPADAGYLVVDDSNARLWRDYKDRGGPRQLGFPLTARYTAGGVTYQVLEAGVLRWNGSVETGYADLFPLFWAMAELQMDDWLEARGIPRTSSHLLENPDLPVETRLSWLTHPALRTLFMQPNVQLGIQHYGLPMGEPERFGPYLAQRFENTVMQLWLDSVPGQPAPGTVTMVQVGDLMIEAGLVPESALTPQPAPAPRPVPQTLPGTGQAPALTVVTPSFGKYIVVARGRQWWYAYEDGQMVFNGPVTTGQPALITPLGKFTVLSRHSPYTMISPWPPSSPYYYEPSNMTYALRITDDGVFLHDAPWRPYYGPGTNTPHTDPDGVYRTGSHGCINLPFSAAAWLWKFAPVGTQVEVVA